MTNVGVYQARTHFYELLRNVAEGEQTIITRHGIPVAKLVPIGEKPQTAGGLKTPDNLRDAP
jgi:prevent-host-death family protein